MEKFSGGYIPVNLNFVASDLLVFEAISEQYAGVCAVLRNILFRGAPTKPSPLIVDTLALTEKYGAFNYYHKQSECKWSETIKGFYSNNPALKFYEELKARLPEYWHLFLPECPFTDISNDPSWPKESSVDFYDPAHKVVIEIDGAQHKLKDNIVNDIRRDDELKRMGVENVIRIPASFSEKDLSNAIAKIRKAIEKENKDLSLSKNRFKSSLYLFEAEYIIAFRIQAALLMFLEKGYFKNNPPIEILEAEGVTERSVKAALADFKKLHDKLCFLAGIEKELDISNTRIVTEFTDEQALKIDVSCDVLYDEEIFKRHPREIRIRNDYFFYPLRDVNNGLEHYPRYKNHYKVACGKIDYSHLKGSDDKYIPSLKFFLEHLFGHKDFRPKQAEVIINGLQSDQGVVGLLPTGSGKSVCFQLVSFLTPGLSIVVSPLSLLMQDQCTNLYSRNLINTAYYINSTTVGRSSIDIFENEQSKITYVAPERFFNERFEKIITKLSPKVSQIVLDEVHCLSEWGHDFRTSYLLLFSFLKKVGISEHSLLMGTSATSSPRVTYDITREFLKLKTNVDVVRSSSVKRPELFFRVVNYKGEEDKNKQLLEMVKANVDEGKKTLVFVPYKKDTDEVKSLFVGDYTIKPETCVGPDSGEKKRKLLINFSNGETNTVIATKAFGMGLDIPDIRETIHVDFSSSVESAYQEMGRAGRDGKNSVCTILFEDAFESKTQTQILFSSLPRPSMIKNFSKQSDFGCIAKQLNLIALSNEDPEKESEFVLAVAKFLSDGKTTFKLSEAFDALLQYKVVDKRFYKFVTGKDGKKKMERELTIFENFFEKALYKLYLLKAVTLWSKNYGNSLDDPIISKLKYREISSSKEITENLHLYINQYESSYKEKANSFGEAVYLLNDWNFENFYKHRWSSLRTLYEMVRDFENSESFASRIENYFAQNEVLEKSIKNPLQYHLWFDALQSNGLEVLKDQLARFIEDYPDQLAVNFITAFVYLMLDNFEDVNGRSRLSLAFNEMGNISKEGMEEILEQISRMPLSVGQTKMILCFFVDEKPEFFSSPFLGTMISRLPRREYEEFTTYRNLRTTIRKMKEAINAVEELL